MQTYQIESKSGVIYGTYDGLTAEDAFFAMVADGGQGEEGSVETWIITEFAPVEWMRNAGKEASAWFRKEYGRDWDANKDADWDADFFDCMQIPSSIAAYFLANDTDCGWQYFKEGFDS